MPETVLGISAFYHDSAAALLLDGRIAAAAQEERFSRVRHDPAFPSRAISCVLETAGIPLSDVGAVAFYDKPLLKFERLLETYLAVSPAGLSQFVASVPSWTREKLFLRRVIRDELSRHGGWNGKLLFPEHHLSHAASAFFPSPFPEAAILTVDGVGEWATTSILHGEGNRIAPLRELRFPHSLGLLYSAFTDYCGFRVNSGEYKLMGLSPYADPGSVQAARFRRLILEEMVDLRPDGSFLLNMAYFRFHTGLRMCRDAAWERLFGVRRRTPEGPLEREHATLALAVQQVTEEIVLRLARTARELTGSANLAMAGGVSLNCVANGKLARDGIFGSIWVQPAAGDAGGAVGAALAAWHVWRGSARSAGPDGDGMQGAYLGPEYGENDILRAARRHGARFRRYGDFDELCREVAALLSGGKTVGWFQGRMEFGPRALGNRSILADPRPPDMQRRVNVEIKRREPFRPFAPAVPEEEADRYFLLDRPSPYMLFTSFVRPERMLPPPPGAHDMPIGERLRWPVSDLPAVTHVDGSARVQTVDPGQNGRFHRLLSAFRERTGCAVLLNTSFNARGEPIVCDPEDAYRCFLRTGLDLLVMGDFLFAKEDQPPLREGGRPGELHGED